MAIVQFRDEQANPPVSISKRMFPPKKVSSLVHWWRQCRKVIHQIPDAEGGEWEWLGEAQISPSYIRWTIVKRADQERRCHVIVDRTAASIG